MASKPILKRSDVPIENTWNLTHLFESDQAWLEEYEAQSAFPEMLEAYKGRLGSSPQVLLEYLRLQDDIAVRLGKLYRYASCSSDQDTANSFYQDLISKARYRHVTSYSASAFSDPEIMEIP
ncbi:MAG: oligoendopeptidase F, partial [Oscillospiraceae bacterium]|nr:oligoendopeptidase F [Oscillospiraceae bacterium]